MVARTPQPVDRLIIRSYHPRDQRAVQQLYVRGLLLGEPDGNDTAADLDHVEDAYFSRPEDHFWVALVEDTVVGMVGVAHDGDRVAQVRRLRVDPDWQHSDVAARLIETALDHCRRHGSLKLILDTHLDPDRAVQMLNGHGFLYTRKRTFFYKDILEFYVNLYHTPQGEPHLSPVLAAGGAA